jgi:hypothetical protein
MAAVSGTFHIPFSGKEAWAKERLEVDLEGRKSCPVTITRIITPRATGNHEAVIFFIANIGS